MLLACAAMLAESAGTGAGPRVAMAGPSLQVQAQLDRREVALGQEATLTVMVLAEGLDLPKVTFPPLPGVLVQRLGDSQGFSWINGSLTRTSTTTFRLQPTEPGEITIPAFRVFAAGAEARSTSLRLRVLRAPPATLEGRPEFFVRLDVDRPRAYWNQAVTGRFTLYSRARLEGSPSWDPPDAPGFWSEVLGPARTGRVTFGGLEYDATELRVAYFPTRAGRLTIGPGRIRVQAVRRIAPPDPWSLLGLPETQVEDLTLETARVPLDVLPLPPGAPGDFRGAVGDYSMDVRVDRMSVRAGEPVTVTTRIRGEGNPASAGDPEVKGSAPARTYAGGARTILDRTGDRLRGERRREVTLIPEAPGPFAILPVRFSWFDPEAVRYRTQVADTIQIQVLPAGAVGDSLHPSRAAAPLAALRGKPGSRGRITLEPPPGARELALGSLLAWAGTWIVLRARERADRDPRRRRIRTLESLLADLRALSAAKRGGTETFVRMAAIVRQAIGLRYGGELEGMPAREALDRIRSLEAPEEEIEQVAELLTVLDQRAFAPRAGEDTGAVAEAREVDRLLRRYREELA